MITIHVNAVLSVRDGFSGKPVKQNDVRCTLNGAPCVPQYKEGGYFVLSNLPPGAYTLLLKSAYFQDEAVEFTAADDAMEERVVQLKPAQNYPFAGRIVRLQGRISEKGKPLPGAQVYVAAQTVTEEIKIAQDQAEAGVQELRIYFRGNSASIRTPGEYLLIDGKSSEIVTVKSVGEETAALAAPLQYAHKRGRAMYPAIGYAADEGGGFMASFREAAPVTVFYAPKRHVQEAALDGEENEVVIEV